jgi:molybdate transport system substrate-binding protein
MAWARYLLIAIVVAAGCSRPPQSRLTVAAAANLSNVMADIGRAFKDRTGVDAVFSYGSTAQLAQQIDHGAPFDVFAAANTENVDALSKNNRIAAGTRAIYARGQLAVWAPKQSVPNLQALTGPSVRFIAIAQPELAPYGRAAVEALRSSGLWEQLQPKLVYANNISIAKQLAVSGNADAAFTAYSLVLHESGAVLRPDPELYKPIDQAVCVVSTSPRAAEARQFESFLLGAEGRAILSRNGYLLP